MAAYFHKVTMGKAVPARLLAVERLEELLRIIESRPTLAEQAALLSELDDRFVKFGQQHGWLAPPITATSDASSVVEFVIEDLLGVRGDSAKDSAIGYLKDELKEIVQEALNKKGKKAFKVLEFLLELAECKSPEDAVRVMSKSGLGKLGTWLAKEETRKALVNALGKRVGMNSKARNKVIRLVAARLTWVELTFSRLARFTPLLAALDVFLSPESTADDATMWRLTFLTAYGRMQASRQSHFGRLISSCAPGTDWTFRAPLLPSLQGAILKMP